MIHNSLFKILSILLIVGLNWFGLSAVMETVAYYNDTENSAENTFSAATLDFSLASPADFSPEVTPTQNSVRDISIINDGILGFEYNLQTEDETGDLCNNLNLTVTRNSVDIGYTGTLKDFTYNAGQFSASEDWVFAVSLPSNDPSLENQTCTFDFVFDGAQIGGAGFSDQEIISNTINSGTWTEPETYEYSPIADSYVDEDHPGSNYGRAGELKIRSKNPGPENKRTFIKFDFHFPIGTIIHSAILKLYMKAAPSNSRTYDAKRVLASWKERDPGPGDGIDWNNQPGVDGLSDSINSGDATPKWLSWGVTSDVQSFVASTNQNYGWRLSDSVESASPGQEAKFYSRESNSINLRPILEVQFSAPEAVTDHLVVNEVYYHVGTGKGGEPGNEWVEIYNPTNSEVNITNWKICDKDACDTIPASDLIPAKGFAVITNKVSTWDKWTIPPEAVKIVLNSAIGNGLANTGDRVELWQGTTKIDEMSYGNITTPFELPLSGKGKSLARIIKGYDTDFATDWIINATPNPGTNPSIDGVETLIFTSYGVAVAGYEPVIEEVGSGEEEIFAEEPAVEVETSVSGLTDEIFEEVIGDEVAPTPIEDEVGAPTESVGVEEVILEVIPEVVLEVVPEEPPVIEEQPIVVEEQPAVEVEVIEEEPAVITPPEEVL